MLNLSVTLKQNFIELIAQQTGIKIRLTDQNTLDEKIFTRIKYLNFSSAEDYYNFLASSSEDNNNNEWEKLAVLLTNLESYFFRDKGQFTLLRNVIIPELINRKQLNKTLRICSAGCSSGQEPYSLAIILKEIIIDIDLWDISIVGLDINKEALKVAKKGSYNNWSFRSVEENLKNKYFTFTHNQYNLVNEIKKMVEFKHCNLVNDLFYKKGLNSKDIDLIICRNVFIYFEQEAINKVISKFYDILKPNGYLITGHAEIMDKEITRFQAKTFPESIVYQRPEFEQEYLPSTSPKKDYLLEKNKLFSSEPSINFDNIQNLNKPENNLIANTYKPVFNPVINNIEPAVINQYIPKQETIKPVISQEKLLEEAKKLFSQNLDNQALEKIQEFLKNDAKNIQAYEFISEIYANQGQYDQAINYCQQALKINSFAVKPHYILSHIAQEQGNQEEAKNLLKKIIYLEPNFLAAYLELSYIYEQEGDTIKQLKMKKEAINLLKKFPLNIKIPELEDFTAQELIAKLEQKS